MEVNIPEVVSEVRAVFDAYEGAMPHYDVETMNLLFWNSPLTLRYGPNGALHGHEAIAAFRKRPSAKGLHRVLHNTVITTFGRDFAVANTEAHSGGRVSYQSQTWVRMHEGWRIVSAHVSDKPPVREQAGPEQILIGLT